MKKVKIIFDFDHTLFSAKKFYEALKVSFLKLGVEEKLFQKTYEKSKGKEEVYNDEVDISGNACYKPFKQFKLIINKKPKIFLEKLKESFQKTLNKASEFLYPDVLKFLGDKKNKFNFVLLSYGEGEFQRKKVKKSKIGKFFKEIIITKDVSKTKPFRKLVQGNEKIIFVEDNPKALFEVKRKFPKVTAVRINRGEGRYSKEPGNKNIDFSIKNLKELEKILKKHSLKTKSKSTSKIQGKEIWRDKKSKTLAYWWKDFQKVYPPLISDFVKKETYWLLQNIKNNSIVLDIGCGWGKDLKATAKIIKKGIGIDWDSGIIKEAERNLAKFNNIEVFCENAEKTPFKENTFDYAFVLGNTFGDFGKSKYRILKEIKRVLKNSGKIIISVYSERALAARKKGYKKVGWEIIKINKGGTVFIKEGKIISEQFSKEKLKRILNEEGLDCKIIELNPISYICIGTKKI